MPPIQTDTPARSPVTRGIAYWIFLICCATALASCLLWRKYPAGAVILAVLGLMGLSYLALSRFAGNPGRAAANGASLGVDEAEKKNSLISVIICSIDPAKYELVRANLRERFGDSPYEIIGIHDARSMCEGYNRGIEKSRGDILIFCHDDIEIISPNFVSSVREHLRTFDVIGCAGTLRLQDSKWISSGDPHVYGVVAYPVAGAWPADRFDVSMWGGEELTPTGGIQALDGFFMAARRHVVESVRFDDRNFDGFHVYDTDFTYSAFLHGFELAVCKDILIAHKSGGNFKDIYQAYAAKFREKYKDRLPEKTGDCICEVTGYRNISHAQMLDIWF